jgi:heme/copper-type cytochrome/quinol oxidase subunit 3
MSELARPETPYSILEREPPEILGANLRVGAHLLASATAFFFVPFLFAYFYLRSLDSHSAFRPKHVAPSTTLGTLATAAIIAAAALVWLALADHRADRRPAWRRKGAVALLLLFASVALQIAEWATQGFGPTDGAYASVYVGWTGMVSLFVLALAFWLETTLAISIRFRNTPMGTTSPAGASGDRDRTAPDIHDPLSLVRPELEALSFFAVAIGAVALFTWFILYVL